MCSNGLFAASVEAGNLVLWDIEERKATFVIPIKNVVQLLIHTAESMVHQLISFSSSPLSLSF